MSFNNNARLAKNTLMLYARMMLLMLISLYTSRVVLDALGINDYGIYNVVGGFVAMFSLISSSLSAGIQRFITYELGKKEDNNLKEIFETSLVVQFAIFGIILLLAETVGLWFINFKLNIGDESRTAANWVYQCSLITFLFNLLSIPYNAAIIAHEKMSAFAYISVIEAILKLTVAFFISWFSSKRLIIYAICLTGTAIIIRLIYTIYCKKHFDECKARPKYHSKIFKEILSFSGWNFLGSMVGILRDQGGSVLLNLFFGPVVNAARGIATQINTAITGFAYNFMTAVNPQITKLFAGGEKEASFNMAFRAAKFSFFIMLAPSISIILNTDYILRIWLKDVPNYTVIFTQLTLVMLLVDIVSPPLTTVMLAFGKLRNFQLISLIGLLNLPLSYLALKMGAEPQITYLITIVLCVSCILCRLFLLKKMVGLSVTQFFKKVVFRIILVTVIVCCPSYLINHVLSTSLLGLILSTIIIIILSGLVTLYLGCTLTERKSIIIKINLILKGTFFSHTNHYD